MSMALSPAALAWKLRTQTSPVPLTPVVPVRAALITIEARRVVAVGEIPCLPVPAQEVSFIHVDQREFCRVVGNPQRNRGNIRASGQDHGNAEGGPGGNRAGRRIERKADAGGGRRSGRGSGGVGSPAVSPSLWI